MANLHEKKWFVYMGERHEGPFSLDEIQEKVNSGTVTLSHYVWADGMPDWEVMSQVPDFSTMTQMRPMAPIPPSFSKQSPLGADLSEPELDQSILRESAKEPSGTFARSVESSAMGVDLISATELESVEPQVKVGQSTGRIQTKAAEPSLIPQEDLKLEQTRTYFDQNKIKKISEEEFKKVAIKDEFDDFEQRNSFKKVFRFAVLLVVVAAAYFAYSTGYLDPVLNQPQVKSALDQIGSTVQPKVQGLLKKVPILGEMIAPLPMIPGITDEDYNRLAAAVSTPLDKMGARVAVAVSSENPQKPVFYLASNLPDGTQFELHAEGDPATLLNRTQFKSQIILTVKNHLAQTDVLQSENGEPLPMGKYRVYAFEATHQPPQVVEALSTAPFSDLRIPQQPELRKKAMYLGLAFLGGKEDVVYKKRLKEFQDLQKSKAGDKLDELKMYASTLQEEFKATVAEHAKLSRIRAPAAKKMSWNPFHDKFTKMFLQMNQTFQTWTPEYLSNQPFYPDIHQLVLQSSQNLLQLHQMQNQSLTTAINLKALVDLQAKTSGDLASLQASIQKAQEQSQSDGLLNPATAPKQ